ncbi:MAG: 23S rRNA (guanosine(2251)-2'-O)-methyltransferase RlmB [Alphaproteobacteria bacterium]|nr:23S rRNA (guanosine(2251)-2'-O)-methyltransferase RlmB [Alphaproteobacteria bacterium]
MARRKGGNASTSRRLGKTTTRHPHSAAAVNAGSERPRGSKDHLQDTFSPRPTREQPAPPDPTLLYGRHAVLAAVGNPRRAVTALWCLEETAPALTDVLKALPALRRDRLPNPETVPRAELEHRLPVGAVHQGWLARVEPLPAIALDDRLAAWADQPSVTLVVLDQVTDPHNVGAVLRSAAAFGAEAVIMQDRHAPPPTAILAKTASGALDVVPLIRVTNLARTLRILQDAAFWCVGLAEEGSRPLHTVDLGGRIALVLGAEGDGLRRLTRQTCDVLAHLPTVPPINSLNVSAAAAIALHQAALARYNEIN